MTGPDVTVISPLVWVGQDYVSCDSSLYVIECSLMDLVPVLGYRFGSFCFGNFGLTHIAPSCPEVTVVLYHAKEVS